MSDKPRLEKATFQFSQEGNCNGSTRDYEDLTIEFDSGLGGLDECDGFFVLSTEGWSIDDAAELEELLNRIRKMTKIN